MKFRYSIALLLGCVLGTWSALAQQTPAKKTTPAVKTAVKTKSAPVKTPAPKAATGNTATGKTATGKTAPVSSRNSRTKSRTPATKTSFQPRQSVPAPDRLKEIQSALAAKGYLKTDPSGVWNADSIDAMKRYQADQKLDPSGKITAASLIGLGLGPGTAAPLVPPSSPTPPPIVPPIL